MVAISGHRTVGSDGDGGESIILGDSVTEVDSMLAGEQNSIRKKSTFQFIHVTLPCNENSVRVCKTFFSAHIKHKCVCGPDKRGKHNTRPSRTQMAKINMLKTI